MIIITIVIVIVRFVLMDGSSNWQPPLGGWVHVLVLSKTAEKALCVISLLDCHP